MLTVKVKCINCGYEITKLDGSGIELYEAALKAAVARYTLDSQIFEKRRTANQVIDDLNKRENAEAEFAALWEKAKGAI